MYSSWFSSTTDFEVFLRRLEALVMGCRVPDLTIKVMAERRRNIVKVSHA